MSSCKDFKENAWRKDLCVNCLKHRQDHCGQPKQTKPATPSKPRLASKPVENVKMRSNRGETIGHKAKDDRLPKFVSGRQGNITKPLRDHTTTDSPVKKSLSGSDAVESPAGVQTQGSTKGRNSIAFPVNTIENKENVMSRSVSYDSAYSQKSNDGSQSPSKRKATDKKDESVSHKLKKERVRSVEFADNEPEIIGYDGGLHCHIDNEEDTFERQTSPKMGSPLSEEEKQFATITFSNTRWNSSQENLSTVDCEYLATRSLEYEDVEMLMWSEKFHKYNTESSKIYGTFPRRVKSDKVGKPSVTSIFRSKNLADLRRRSGVFKTEKANRDSNSTQSSNEPQYALGGVDTHSDHYKTPLSIDTNNPVTNIRAGAIDEDPYKIPTNDLVIRCDPEYFVLDLGNRNSSGSAGSGQGNWSMHSTLSPTELAHQEVPVEQYRLRESPKHQFARPYRVVDVAPSSRVMPYTIVDVSASLPVRILDSEAPALPQTPAPGGQERAESPPQKAAKTSPTHKTASPKNRPAPRASLVYGTDHGKTTDSDKNGIYETVGEMKLDTESSAVEEAAFVRNENVRLSAGKTPAFAAKMAAIANTVDFNKSKQKRHAPSPPTADGTQLEENRIKPPLRKQKLATRLNSQQNYLSNKEVASQVTARPTSPPAELPVVEVSDGYSHIKDTKNKKGKSFFKKLLNFRNKDTNEYDLCSNPGSLSPEAKFYVESWLTKSMEHLNGDEEVFSDQEDRKDISSPVLISQTSTVDARIMRSTSSDGKLLDTQGSADGNVDSQPDETVSSTPTHKSTRKSPSKRPPPPPPPSSAKPSLSSLRSSISETSTKDEKTTASSSSPRRKENEPPANSNSKDIPSAQKARKVPIVIKKPRPPPPPVDKRPRSATLPNDVLLVTSDKASPPVKPFRASVSEVVGAKKQLSKGRSCPTNRYTTGAESSPYDAIDSSDELDPDYPTIPPPDPPKGDNHYELVASEGDRISHPAKKDDNVYDVVGAPSSEGNTCSTCTSQGSALEGYLEPVVTVNQDSMREIEKQLKRHSQEIIQAEIESALKKDTEAALTINIQSKESTPVPMPRRRTRSRNADSPSLSAPISDPYVLLWKDSEASLQAKATVCEGDSAAEKIQNTRLSANLDFSTDRHANLPEKALEKISELNSCYIREMLKRTGCNENLVWCCDLRDSFQYNDFKLSDVPVYVTGSAVCYRAVHIVSAKCCTLVISAPGKPCTHITTTFPGTTVINLPHFQTQVAGDIIPSSIGQYEGIQKVDVTVVPSSGVSGLGTVLSWILTETLDVCAGQRQAALYLLQLCKTLQDGNCGRSLEDVYCWNGSELTQGQMSVLVEPPGNSTCKEGFCKMMKESVSIIKSHVATDTIPLNNVLKYLSNTNNATIADHQMVIECYLWGPNAPDAKTIVESTNPLDSVRMWLCVEKTKLIGDCATGLETASTNTHRLQFLLLADAMKLCEIIKLLFK